jgi:glutathione S-transferase
LPYDIEEAIGLLKEMHDSWAPNLYIGMRPRAFGYSEGYAKTEEGKNVVKKTRETWITNELPKWLTWLEEMMERNGAVWLVSSTSPTIADCVAVPMLRAFSCGFIDYVSSDSLDTFSQDL